MPLPQEAGGWWKRLLPYLLGLFLLGYVAWSIDLHALLGAFQTVNYWAYGAMMFCFVVVLLLADALAMHAVFSKNIGPVKVSDLVVLRGASYLPAVLNYHLGQAWLTWFVSKVHRVPVTRVVGATLLVYATMLGGLVLLGSIAYFLQPEAFPWLLPVLVVSGLAALGYLGVIARRPARLLRIPTTNFLLDAGVLGHLRALVFRLPHVIILFFSVWWPYELFDIHLSLADALTLLPPILLVGALPLTPQGMGTRELAAIQLLSPFGPGNAQQSAAAVAAGTFAWSVTLIICQSLLSPFLMKRAQGLLRSAAGTKEA